MRGKKTIIIVGGGPAGLMAAEVASAAGLRVELFEKKPSLARKFLMAGRGGLNLTHSEAIQTFLQRYGSAAEKLEPAIRAFPPAALRQWCEDLGEATFIGTSGRVFPKSMKASPLLRAWQARLAKQGVTFHLQHAWVGWNTEGDFLFQDANGNAKALQADAALLALGGASWPRLGSDGKWAEILMEKGIPAAPFAPSNCGFKVIWSDFFRQKFAGEPLKPVILSFGERVVQGEAMITATGIEGGAVYALSSALRDEIAATGRAILNIDLRPAIKESDLGRRLNVPRQAKSFGNFLRVMAGLSPIAIALLREAEKEPQNLPAQQLAHLIKALPLKLEAPFPLERAISSAGGIRLDAIDERFMLKNLPGVFVAGEMLDWEAPTGGYLLQATFSTAVAAARGIIDYCAQSVR